MRGRFTLTQDEQIQQDKVNGFQLYFTDTEYKVIALKNGLILKVYSGRSAKPREYIRLPTEERLKTYFEKWFTDHKKTEDWRKGLRVIKPMTLKIGDVLHSSWGWEQTNNDYYEVVAIKGKRTVILREIASSYKETGHLCGERKPLPGKFISEPFEKRVCNTGNSVNIDLVRHAHFEKPISEVDGVKIYESHYDSSYA